MQYRPIEPSEIDQFSRYVLNLYDEDAGGEPMGANKIQRTIDHLEANPQNGSILAILSDSVMVGYAILIHYWSNEWGGVLLYIDELYIDQAYRNQKVGSAFIQHLKETKYNDCKAVCLEVRADNLQAKRLYARLGFKPAKLQTLRWEVD
jgi:ribosomal protein S18 acetylase RimI-like enzyme